MFNLLYECMISQRTDVFYFSLYLIFIEKNSLIFQIIQTFKKIHQNCAQTLKTTVSKIIKTSIFRGTVSEIIKTRIFKGTVSEIIKTRILKGTVSVIFSEPQCKDDNARFSMEPLKVFSDHT